MELLKECKVNKCGNLIPCRRHEKKLHKLTKTEKAILYLARCIENGLWQGVERKTLAILELEPINENKN